ncbi:MAG: hypothetical protein ACJAXK_000590 [Yoonia sp.]|jgi:hypothetical protein
MKSMRDFETDVIDVGQRMHIVAFSCRSSFENKIGTFLAGVI